MGYNADIIRKSVEMAIRNKRLSAVFLVCLGI
mgnify:FL=1